MDQFDTKIDLIYGSVTYISWSSGVALYLEDYLTDEGHTWDSGSM